MTWPCFIIRDSGRVHRFLRRYTSWDEKKPCPDSGGNSHDILVPFDVVEREPETMLEAISEDEYPPRHDPRWPVRCNCGYEFTAGDPWQVFQLSCYVDDEGNEYTIRNGDYPGLAAAPAGAMWKAWWYTYDTTLEAVKNGNWKQHFSAEWRDESVRRGELVMPWAIRLPDGRDFMPWNRASNGQVRADGWQTGWKVTGVPPKLTTRPSIGKTAGHPEDYHGWLNDGILSDDVEGRSF